MPVSSTILSSALLIVISEVHSHGVYENDGDHSDYLLEWEQALKSKLARSSQEILPYP